MAPEVALRRIAGKQKRPPESLWRAPCSYVSDVRVFYRTICWTGVLQGPGMPLPQARTAKRVARSAGQTFEFDLRLGRHFLGIGPAARFTPLRSVVFAP